MRKYINQISYLLPLILLGHITSCSSFTFTPKELPPAKVGEYYYAEIQILGGGAPVASFSWYINPENGLFVDGIDREGAWKNNLLKIYGTPLNAGYTEVILKGFTYGTSFEKFNKTYIIKVIEGD